MDYLGPIAGSPLVPPLVIILGIIFAFLTAGTLFFAGRYRHHLFIRLLALQLLFLGAATVAAAYWFLPTPSLASTIPPASLAAPLTIRFSRPVSRRTMVKEITPEVAGIWVFEQPLYSTHVYRQVSFYPDSGWQPDTVYSVQLAQIRNLVSTRTATAEFTFHSISSPGEITATSTAPDQTSVSPTPVPPPAATPSPPPSFRLNVPAYLQQHALSCEVAALRMALAFYGVKVSEETLLDKVGVDNTPYKDGVWGNPHEKFVGNVDGKQLVSGYGVYWNPIARVANEYRPAEAFSGWSISQLTAELKANHPVVIWVYVRSGVPVTWKTTSGQEIFAIRDEHSVTVVGFVGPTDDPTQIIVNDPLVGRAYWSRAMFERKWNSFGRSGVAVR